jgi:shikimate 5-dehydrogenase
MKFGLIGHPIEHSLSPALFRAGYDGRYPYELIQTDDFEEAYARFLADYDGINVTAPFKELAIKKADILSEECKAIGATNLLIKTPEGIKAYNSDFRGLKILLQNFLESIPNVNRAPSGAVSFASARLSKKVEAAMTPVEQRETACPSGLSRSDWGVNNRPRTLVLGLGGAGKAAAEAARSLGCEVILMNRTQYTDDIRPLSEFREAFKAADIIIYNLPVRLPELDLLGQEDFIEGRKKHILEANYRNPSFDKELLHKLTEAHSLLEYTSGETWLLMQALTGYEIFTGEKPDLEKMAARL